VGIDKLLVMCYNKHNQRDSSGTEMGKKVKCQGKDNCQQTPKFLAVDLDGIIIGFLCEECGKDALDSDLIVIDLEKLQHYLSLT